MRNFAQRASDAVSVDTAISRTMRDQCGTRVTIENARVGRHTEYNIVWFRIPVWTDIRACI